MKNYNMILTEKQEKYQHCDQYKYLAGEEILLASNQNKNNGITLHILL